MTDKATGKEVMKDASLVLGHGLAAVVGLLLMFAGLAMGVSLASLPLGIPLGLIGLAVFVWGLFGWSQAAPAGPTPLDTSRS
jgi:hypothetical protein